MSPALRRLGASPWPATRSPARDFASPPSRGLAAAREGGEDIILTLP
jgi:hypothetical protein